MLDTLSLRNRKKKLKNKKYPKMVVEKGIVKAVAVSKEQLRSEKRKEKDFILPFLSPYNPNSPNRFQK